MAMYNALPASGLANAFLAGTPAATNLFQPSSPFYNKKYNFPKPNPATAQKLFDKLAAAGTPVSFTYTVPIGFETLGQYIQAELSKFKNVTVKVEVVTTAVYITKWRGGTYQATQGNLYWANPIPLAVLNLAGDGTLNYLKWNNAKVNAALADVQKTTDLAQQKKDWNIVQEQFIADRPALTAQQGMFGVAYTKQITNVNTAEFGTIPLWGEISATK